jgi:hypothetical protein
MGIELAFPEKLLKKRDELARRGDALFEELVTETPKRPPAQLADPETKTALHRNLSEQYLRSAEAPRRRW